MFCCYFRRHCVDYYPGSKLKAGPSGYPWAYLGVEVEVFSFWGYVEIEIIWGVFKAIDRGAYDLHKPLCKGFPLSCRHILRRGYMPLWENPCFEWEAGGIGREGCSVSVLPYPAFAFYLFFPDIAVGTSAFSRLYLPAAFASSSIAGGMRSRDISCEWEWIREVPASSPSFLNSRTYLIRGSFLFSAILFI